MKTALTIGIALLSAAANAADPPKRTPLPPKPAAVKPSPAKPLDLKIGDVRKYMTPKDYLAAISAPDADSETVVVEGERVLLPVRQIERLPPGLGSLIHVARHPSQSWRLLLPDAYAKAAEPVYDVVPPPIFRWGP